MLMNRGSYRRTAAIILLAVLGLNCKIMKGIQSEALIMYESTDLANSQNGELMTISDSLTVLYLKNYIIYKIGRPVGNSIVNVDKDYNFLNEKYLPEYTLYDFYLYKKGDSTIREHQTYNNIDTTINYQKFFQGKPVLYASNIFDLDKYVLVSKRSIELGEIWLYIPKSKPDDTYDDTTFVYFSKISPSGNISLCPKLEAQEHKRVVKLIFLYNPIPKGRYSFPVPKRQYIFEIIQASIKDEKELLEFFKKNTSDTL
jgi:hypothetical protein